MLATSGTDVWYGAGAVWKRRAEELSAGMPRPFMPLMVSPRPETDAVAMLVGALRPPFAEEAARPEFAVVHIPSAEDRAPVSAALLKLEPQGSPGPLPALILSPLGKLTLDECATKNRPHVLLPTPVAPAQLLAAAAALAGVGPVSQAA